ncbi:DUF6950 family protein [Ketogulonicigenium vulgare]|uniref:DUF6950 family protein n=1 Tax=Ketogulonicigenium vulgare TaxID=92945 RepID=UPI00235A3839|nr:hypothetical protein [Ketogulonicigenium vulgare]
MVQKGSLTGDLARLPDWRARLSHALDIQRDHPFEWGRHDCGLGLAAGAVEAITGADLRPAWANYKTPTGALRVLRKAGYESLGDAMAALLPEAHPAFAQIGDLALLDGEGQIGALGVIDISSVIVLDKTGHARVPRDQIKRAFKVG